jgi:hypothetical protein
MAPASPDPVARLDALLALFNRGSLDLPEGALARDAIFRLNGVAYEESLGRSPADPLVRLVARGAGGYRFLAKGLRFAMPDATVTLDAHEVVPGDKGCLLRADGWLRGRLRRGGAVEEPFAARITFSEAAAIVDLDVALTPDAVGRIAAARRESGS